VLFKKDEGC